MSTRDFILLYCADGQHDWKAQGGRPCPMVDQQSPCPITEALCSQRGYPSQPAFRCTRCGEWDYGEKGGPGWDHCTGCMRGAI